MVVSIDVAPFVEDRPAGAGADARRDRAELARLQPVGYLPLRHQADQRGGWPAGERRLPAPHGVTWYLRRLLEGQHASPEALARAAAIGLVVPAGYTFVDAHVWPRAADPRSLATALRTTVALSSLRAILDAARARLARQAQ